MNLTLWGHSCVRLSRDGNVLVIDPGGFSDLTVLAGADAVLITHEHPDHVAVEPLVQALENRAGVGVWAPAPVVELLADAGTDRERLHEVRAGDRFTAATLAVEVLGDTHAVVHPDVPTPVNVAYLVEGTVLHPGDSFTVPAAGGPQVEVMLVPVSAPWLKISEAVDHVRAVAPRTAVPIHDALLSEIGIGLVDRLMGSLGRTAYRRLAVGEELVTR
ncbi:MBL fold metallo-hydrolase [Actinotalea sp. K2]|uniref:MBL fold metallo-hydrolase n=1 Tax=Actinotalea sp. K2 TaxID=2939438 RepID=UPI002017BC0A|nr:MBL fold metallo-hydrolase [Actinotalea sp. K2]MCL3860976.1 MBL fold metallo-hydrolase [Actinotalea sp. K2]